MKSNALLWIVKQIRNRIPALLVMTAAQVGHSLLSVLFALGCRTVIDSAVAGNSEAFAAACWKQAAIIAAVLICMTVVRYLQERLWMDLERDWKKRMLHKLLQGEYSRVSSYHSAELLNRMNNDAARVSDGVMSIVPGALSMLARLAAAVVVLGALDIRFTALLALLGIFVIVATGLMRKYLKELNKRVSEHDGLVYGFLQEIMEKLLLVQAMDISAEVERRADGLMSERYEVQKKRRNISLVSNSAVSIFRYCGGFLALCWCAAQMLAGRMSFGSLTAVTQLVNQLQTPFFNLSGIMPQYIAMIAAAERLKELDDIPAEQLTAEEDCEALYDRMNGITAEKLTFSFDRDLILNNASFSLPKGAFAVVTGPSGIGKSTVLKLLMGIYAPDTGTVTLDGADGKRKVDRSCRRLFAYVPQGNLLFSGTIRENLTIVRPESTEEELQQAVHISCMDEFVAALPQGLDTLLGENGMGLSEGQAQRLAIARAVLSGAPVMLLDECTSALDEKTESLLLERLRSLTDRTCIAVTHRPAAVAICDWQIVIQDKEVYVVRVRD